MLFEMLTFAVADTGKAASLFQCIFIHRQWALGKVAKLPPVWACKILICSGSLEGAAMPKCCWFGWRKLIAFMPWRWWRKNLSTMMRWARCSQSIGQLFQTAPVSPRRWEPGLGCSTQWEFYMWLLVLLYRRFTRQVARWSLIFICSSLGFCHKEISPCWFNCLVNQTSILAIFAQWLVKTCQKVHC